MEIKISQVANASKIPNHKYANLYKEILNYTSFLDEKATFIVRWWYWQNKITSPVLCACGCNKPLLRPHKTKYLQGHSNSSEEVKQTKIKVLQEKYGPDITNVSQIEEVKQKKEQVFMEKFGTTSPLDRKLVEPIWKEKYGVDNPSRLASTKQKLSETHKIIQNSPEVQEKRKNTRKVNFYESLKSHPLWEPLFTLEDYKGANKGHYYEFKCKACGTIRKNELNEGTNFRCYTCSPRIASGGQSMAEHKLELFCKSLSDSFESQNRQVIAPLELDLYSEKFNLGIEHHGLYWHSTQRRGNKFDHRMKLKNCDEKGIRLIQIFEDEWRDKPQIVKSRLRHICGLTKYKIFARKCKVVKIEDKALKKKFLDKYHIQGNDKSSVWYGLTYKNRLVSVMTFGAPRNALGNKKKVEGNWELVRYCTVQNFSIVGGAQRLLKHFIRDHQPTKIITYADARWSQGNLYEQIGFTKTGFTLPNYHYVVNNKRVHRFAYQKHTLAEKLEIFDPALSETENMSRNGYYQIWDCGHHRYEMTFENS